MNMLVILTARGAQGGTTQIMRNTRFDPGTTRTESYRWAVAEASLDRLAPGAWAVTFFYCEPDEVAA